MRKKILTTAKVLYALLGGGVLVHSLYGLHKGVRIDILILSILFYMSILSLPAGLIFLIVAQLIAGLVISVIARLTSYNPPSSLAFAFMFLWLLFLWIGSFAAGYYQWFIYIPRKMAARREKHSV